MINSKNNFKIFLISGIFILISLLNFNCTKTDENFGYNIIPDADKVELLYTDTTTISASTYSGDTLISSAVTVMLLGAYNDQFCKKAKASFAVQFAPEISYRFLTVDIADSVVLSLPLRFDSVSNNSYGDLTKPQTVNVYRLSSGISYRNTYYSHQNPQNIHDGELLGTIQYIPSKTDTIRITLKSSIADEFINSDDSVYTKPEIFQNFFQGVYVETLSPDSEEAIVKIDRNAGLKLEVFYHKESTTTPISAKFVANNEECAAFNLFEHDFSTADFYADLNTDGTKQEYTYIQEMKGLRAKIMFPFLNEWKRSGRYVIKRAELILETADSEFTNETDYPAIQKLLLTGIKDDGSYYLLPEYNMGSSYAGVTYNKDTKQYRFDIAAYLTSILNGSVPNNGVFIFSTAGKVSVNRSIIKTDKIRLAVTYVDL